jgi:hypothetical protein
MSSYKTMKNEPSKITSCYALGISSTRSPSSYRPSDKPYAVTTPEGMTVAIVKGKLAEQRAQAIVNTTSKDLNLNSGPVSKSILQAAGPQIQVRVLTYRYMIVCE